MRKIALVALLSLWWVLPALANKVTVNGQVVLSSGAPVVGKTIWMVTGLNNTAACNLKDSAKTNQNGYFSQTLLCEAGDIRWVILSFKNCEGQLVSKTFEVPASGIVEAKFTDCQPMHCKAFFTAENANNTGNAFVFNSGGSGAGNNDEILRRVWTFGDGTALEGNLIITKKEYPLPGTYEVCLKIVTRSGCTSTYCRKITVGPATVPCKAGIAMERIPSNTASGMASRFNSAPSAIAAGDEIVSRFWNFGNGVTLGGNIANPTHQYTAAGKYEVCLTIKTKSGYESKTCISVIAEPLRCTPTIATEMLPGTPNTIGLPVRFNSMYAQGQLTDEIISRTWIFGDGRRLEVNIPNPVHVYEKAGEYRVCLVTKTRLGCVSEVCTTIKVQPLSLKCEARFRWEQHPERVAYFTASPTVVAANDPVVKTTWWFGDGTSQTINGVETKHQYASPGTYEVCLLIVTKSGCESRWCGEVEIGSSNHLQKCLASSQVDNSQPGRVLFNSEGSHTLLPDDKIIARRWEFGNGKVLEGNVVKTEMHYPFGGRFNVCLTIKTAKGCEARICKTIEVKPGPPPMNDSRVWLVRQYPNPVKQDLYAVIFSPKDNEDVELAIIDVYGQLKSAIKAKVPKGYSTHRLNASALRPGPYLLRVRSAYGVQTVRFFKVN